MFVEFLCLESAGALEGERSPRSSGLETSQMTRGCFKVASHSNEPETRRAGQKAENAERQPSDDRYFTPEKNILKLG